MASSQNNIGKVIAYVGLFLMTLALVFVILAAMVGDAEVEDVDCFDRHSNKIDGLVCEEEIYYLFGINQEFYLILVIFSGFIGGVVGVVIDLGLSTKKLREGF